MDITVGSTSNGYVGYYAVDIFKSLESTSKITIDASGYVFYEGESNKFLLYYKGEETNLTLPTLSDNKKYKIKDYAFYRSNIKSISIPDCVTSIGNYAFYNCTSLTSITIPNSVTSIGTYAFYYCTSLTNIKLPNGIANIYNSTFYKCTSLTSITIPESVSTIGQYAFYLCTSLTSITILSKIAIYEYAFSSCDSLNTVYYYGTKSEWDNRRILSGNNCLKAETTTRYYYSETEPNLNEEGTAYDDNYWHYVDGEIVVWNKQ